MTNLVDKYESSIFNVSRMRLNFLSAAIDNVKWCARSDDVDIDGGIFNIHIHCIGIVYVCVLFMFMSFLLCSM